METACRNCWHANAASATVRSGLPDFTAEQVATWARNHQQRSGRWPRCYSGPIREAPGKTWQSVERALREGTRGFPRGDTLARFLARLGVRNNAGKPHLTEQTILGWADTHYQRTGRWPTQKSGAIPEAPGETWLAVHNAMYEGLRGLKGIRSMGYALPLTRERILSWAQAHRASTGNWPRAASGAIPEAPGERWANVEMALREGLRGLPGGDTLFRFLQRESTIALDDILTVKTLLSRIGADCLRTLIDAFERE